MKSTTTLFRKGTLMQFFAVLGLMLIGGATYAAQHDGALLLRLKASQLLSATGAANVVRFAPIIDETPICLTDQRGQKGIIYVSAPNLVKVVVLSNGSPYTAARINEPAFYPNGSYRLEVILLDTSAVIDQSSIRSFDIAAQCGSAAAPQAPADPPGDAAASQVPPASTSTATSTDGVPTAPTSTPPNLPPPPPLPPTSPQPEAFSLSKSYPQNWNIIPTIYKNNVRVFSAQGIVNVRVEIPGGKGLLLLGSKTEWTTGGIFDETRGFKPVPGTNRFEYIFDSSHVKDGGYRFGAAYLDPVKGWVMTGTVDFDVSNSVILNPIVSTTTTLVATNTSYTKPTEYSPTWKSTGESVNLVTTFAPMLRLVVNDRAINALNYTFDREELELRVTTLPAQGVQFFAYSLDGAFKPAIKELGKGGKDEILSRDGKEVWVYTNDMSNVPAGNFKLFARVRDLEGKLSESQPISIVVQHLNQMVGAPAAKEVDMEFVSEATREDILKRIHDPSGCQNRQECQVFCSNSAADAEKCLQYTRVKGNNGLSAATETEVKKLQDEVLALVKGKEGALVTQMLSQLEGGTTTSTDIPRPTSTAWKTPEYTGKPSLVDFLPLEILEKMLSVKHPFVADLPAEIVSVPLLQQYCGSVEHEIRCIKLVTSLTPDFSSVIEKQLEIIRNSESRIASILEQRSGARAFIDSDGDSVSDFDEVNLYHSDPGKRDSNGDGYSDGAALLGQTSIVVDGGGGVNALGKIILGEDVTVENPKITGSTQSSKFAIASIAPIEKGRDTAGKEEIKKIAFKGIALPNSFVKIFIFSEPVVVTVKTDDQGNWSYILDKTLPDGAHTAYVALSDGGGRILAKSSPVPFIKEASAITISGDTYTGGAPDSKLGFMGLSPITLVALLIGVLGLALSVIGVVVGMHNKKQSLVIHRTDGE